MSTIESFPSWIKQIPGKLYNLDEKPLLGFPPEFPWNQFSKELTNSLQIPSLSITPTRLEWRAEAELFQGLGDHLKPLSLSVAPLSGSLWWLMPEKCVANLMNNLLNKTPATGTTTLDDNFFKAFYHFLAAEAINSFDKTGFDKKLIPSILKEQTLPAEPCLGLDITFTIDKETFYGRLLLSQTFRKSWTQRYIQQQNTLALSSPIADTLDVIVHLEAGNVSLKPSEWQRIVPGDFVVLDHCSLDAEEDKGRVMLVINDTPFFRAKIKQGSLKILEHPLYYEVNTPMGTPPKNNKNEEAFDDSDLDDFDFDDEDSLPTETSSEESSHKENEDLEISDEELSKIEKQKTTSLHQNPSLQKTKTTGANTPPSIDEIPLNVVIEIGRIQMSVKKLLELQPGNMLDLNIHPESGVDMVVNGKKIATGELLKIGDALGIRILELS